MGKRAEAGGNQRWVNVNLSRSYGKSASLYTAGVDSCYTNSAGTILFTNDSDKSDVTEWIERRLADDVQDRINEAVVYDIDVNTIVPLQLLSMFSEWSDVNIGVNICPFMAGISRVVQITLKRADCSVSFSCELSYGGKWLALEKYRIRLDVNITSGGVVTKSHPKRSGMKFAKEVLVNDARDIYPRLSWHIDAYGNKTDDNRYNTAVHINLHEIVTILSRLLHFTAVEFLLVSDPVVPVSSFAATISNLAVPVSIESAPVSSLAAPVNNGATICYSLSDYYFVLWLNIAKYDGVCYVHSSVGDMCAYLTYTPFIKPLTHRNAAKSIYAINGHCIIRYNENTVYESGITYEATVQSGGITNAIFDDGFCHNCLSLARYEYLNH